MDSGTYGQWYQWTVVPMDNCTYGHWYLGQWYLCTLVFRTVVPMEIGT